MRPDTGAIASFETRKDAEAAGYTIPLRKELAEQLSKLKRSERLEVAGLGPIARRVIAMTASHPLAKLAGMSDDDLRQLRNAAKREHGTAGDHPLHHHLPPRSRVAALHGGLLVDADPDGQGGDVVRGSAATITSEDLWDDQASSTDLCRIGPVRRRACCSSSTDEL